MSEHFEYPGQLIELMDGPGAGIELFARSRQVDLPVFAEDNRGFSKVSYRASGKTNASGMPLWTCDPALWKSQ